MFDIRQLEQTVFQIWVNQAQAAYTQLIADLEANIAKMRAEGISDAEIFGRLKQDMADNTDGFSTFKGWVEGETDKLTHSVAQGNAHAEMAQVSGLFSWELDPTASEHCDDCLRNSTVDPMLFESWAILGLPGSGNTICDGWCKCALRKAA